ncbi:MAG: MMPL family transporter [Actinomycetota bacterium]
MARLGHLVVTRPRTILLGALVALVAAAAWGGDLSSQLSTGGNEVPGSDSVEAAELLAAAGDIGSPNLVVLIEERPAIGEAAEAVAEQVRSGLAANPEIEIRDTAWDTGPGRERLRSEDGIGGLVVAHIAGTDPEVQSVSAIVVEELRAGTWPDGVTVEVGGVGPTRHDIIETTDTDLVRAELLALPLSMLLLLFVFRTPVAAALPLVVAAVAVLGTVAVLRALVEVTEVSVFARSVATALGLAMAVDMTLFLVDRYREHRAEQAAGAIADRSVVPDRVERAAAVRAALLGAGPAILLSGLTTAASLAALLLFSTPLLRSFAYAGSVVVLLSLVGGLVVLPAAIMVLGPAIDRWPVRGDRRNGRGWARLARSVMARPLLVGGAVLIVLLVVASPVRRIELGLNDDRVLPDTVESRRVNDRIRSGFPGLEGGAVSVVFVEASVDATAPDIEAYAADLAELDGVARVAAGPGSLTVVPEVEPISGDGRALVEAIRALPSPVPVVVGGEAARFVDNTDHVLQRLPWVVAAILVINGVLLASLFRSVVAPIKALVLNLVSLSAMFGAIVWIFQDGRLTGLLGYTPTGLTDVTVPMLMFAVAFGLSMDYEVYLLARIRERYLVTGDSRAATVDGLQRTGRILTASALLMSVVFLSFATGSVTHLKILGLGITLAVLVDAFLVRALLVPSFLAVAGSINWWPTVVRRPAAPVEPPPTVLDLTAEQTVNRPASSASSPATR